MSRFVGTVVSGVILSGQVKTGDTVLIGPDSLGHFTTTSIKAMQRKRVNVNQAHAGQSVSFALKRVRRENVRKGMVIVPKSDDPPRGEDLDYSAALAWWVSGAYPIPAWSFQLCGNSKDKSWCYITTQLL